MVYISSDRHHDEWRGVGVGATWTKSTVES